MEMTVRTVLRMGMVVAGLGAAVLVIHLARVLGA
jgi:hypothetical protein